MRACSNFNPSPSILACRQWINKRKIGRNFIKYELRRHDTDLTEWVRLDIVFALYVCCIHRTVPLWHDWSEKNEEAADALIVHGICNVWSTGDNRPDSVSNSLSWLLLLTLDVLAGYICVDYLPWNNTDRAALTRWKCNGMWEAGTLFS